MRPLLCPPSTDYTYDPWTGQVSSIIRRDDEEEILSSFLYEYDEASQLVSKTGYQPELDVDPVTTDYAYDNQGQLTEDGEIDYAYDANGNRDYGDYQTGDGPGGDPDDNRLYTDGNWVYEYDADGNRTSRDEVGGDERWEYIYDHRHQLIQVDRKSNGIDIDLTVEYRYDIWGNRIRKWVDLDGPGILNATLLQFALDGWNPLKTNPIGTENVDVWADLDIDGSLKTRYLRGDGVDELFGRVDVDVDVDQYWYLTDSLGSIRDVINHTGANTDSLAYDAYGNITDETAEASRGRYAWTGREVEVEIGLQFNRARFYDAIIGQWISSDPIRFESGDSNLYRYARSAPLQHRDPSGLQESDTGDAGRPVVETKAGKVVLNPTNGLFAQDPKRPTKGKYDIRVDVEIQDGVLTSNPQAKGKHFSISYKGAEYENVHLIQTFWTEVIVSYKDGTTAPLEGTVATTVGMVTFTTNRAKPVWHLDTSNKKAPYYTGVKRDKTTKTFSAYDAPGSGYTSAAVRDLMKKQNFNEIKLIPILVRFWYLIIRTLPSELSD